MDATQMISDSILESEEEENEEDNENKRGQPLAKLCILKNEHIPETELPLFLGDNVLGRDPSTCTLPLPAPSISKQHATICISVYRRRGCHSEVDTEALVWDLGSMNGTRKGRLKLTPNVRYALSENDRLVVADIPCQYVSCTVDGVSSEGDTRTPVNRNSGLKTRLPDASGQKRVDTSTGSRKCVNGSCLSFEQTPTQPQGSLVPESDLDSDGERGGGGARRCKALVSDSDSCKSSPNCSTFLSPTNKIVPESEDESPITPSSTKNRPYRHVSFSKTETDVDVGRQQLREEKALAIVYDSEEEEGREEERSALGGRNSEESGQHVPVKQEGNVSLAGVDELPVSTPAVFTDAIPAFNMDSDTDMEGEEEVVASAGPVTLNTNQQADQPPNTAQFLMDSDTDVDEDDDAFDKVPKSVPSSADNTRPPHVISVIQPEAITTMDSDTDVDDDAVVSDAATKAKPMSFQSTHRADSAPSSQLKDFHLDSDTDVDEEEEKEHGTNKMCTKIDETPIRLDIKPIGPESAPAAPHSLHLDSDTDDEAIPAPANSEHSVVSAVTESCTTADKGADLGILSDSDTDMEDNSPLFVPVVVTTLSAAPGTTSQAFQSDSDADTDVEESSVPPAGDGVIPADPRVDSDTDVGDKEVNFGEAGVGQIPSLHREDTPGLLAPLLQNCSTPVQLTEGDVEDMATQAFLSSSSGPFRLAPAVRPKALSSCSDSQEDEDFVVAETQSFVLQNRDCRGNHPEDHTMDPTQAFVLESSGDEKGEQSNRGGSFQLGLSDSSHLQGQAQVLAMESTQAFLSVEGGVNLEETQAYAAISNADRTSLESDSNLEATQAFGEDEEPARCSVISEKERQVDLALEATQAYISEPYSDSEDKTDDERKNTSTAETKPLDFSTSSAFAMAETQPMSVFEEEESLDEENPISSVLYVKPKSQNETEDRKERGEAAQPQERHFSEAPFLAETQPMRTSDDEESDDEDSIPGPRKRKAKQLWLEEEETQTLTNSEASTVETQPLEAKAGLRPEKGQGRQSEAATSGITIKNKRGTRSRVREEEEQAECSEPPKRQTRGKNKAFPTTRQMRGKSKPDESEEDEEAEQAKQTRGKQSMRQRKDDEEEEDRLETERNKHDENNSLIKEQEKGRLGEEKNITELRQQEREKMAKKRRDIDERDRKQEERQHWREEQEKLEMAKTEKEEQERLQAETKPLDFSTSSAFAMAETQPMSVFEEEESLDEENPISSVLYVKPKSQNETEDRKERGEAAQPQERHFSEAPFLAETQPMRTSDDEESDDEDSIPGPRKRKAKQLWLEEEETQTLTNSEASTVETQPLEAKAGLRPEKGQGRQSEAATSGITIKNKRGTRSRVREEEEQAECSEPPKRQTRGKNKAFPTTRQMRGKSKPDESEEDEEAEQAKQTRGKQSMRQRKDDEEEEDRLETERNKHDENNSLIKEQEKGRLGEEKNITELRQQEREKMVKKRRDIDERDRKQEERQHWREEQEKLEMAKTEKEEQERLQAENAERLRLEWERAEQDRIERERKEQEEKERSDRTQKEKEEQLERERKEKEEKARLEGEKAEREERERLEREEKERREKERLETAKRELEERLERERKEQEHQARLEREAKEREEKEAKEKQIKEQEENEPKAPARSRRAAKKTTDTPCTTEPEQDSTISTNDDVPARRTRSRSNSSNSVSSERSASSVTTQQSRGRSRGRGAKRTSEPPQAAIARSSNRRRTLAAEPTEQASNDISPQGVLSRSNSTNSLNSEISSCSLSSQGRGRGGRQRGRGRITEAATPPPINIQSDQNLAPKPTTRGRKSRKTEESSSEVTHEDYKEKADSQQASTTWGRRRANTNGSEPADEEDPSIQEERCASEESLLPKRNVRSRGQKAVKDETAEAPEAPATGSDGDQAKEKRKGRKRELATNTEEDSSSSAKMSKGKEEVQPTEAAEEGAKGETKDEIPLRAKRGGRVSSSQTKSAKNPPTQVEVKEESEKMEEEAVERRVRGRTSAVQKKKKEEQEESGTSGDQDVHVEASEPQTPTSSVSRKRQALADSSPVAKTPRSSFAATAVSGRLRIASQAYKVLFTGMVDEAGERVLARLGGSIAKGVADMNCLVTDKVRRTVKFLCAVAKGVPVVTTHWLDKSGKAGSFLTPNAFIVKDPEQEKKFHFCLQESLRMASNQPLLQGYEIHVTKSVKPEPVQMKDIITCSGATFLPKMPSSHKPQTVVVSCEEDWPLCGPALSASLPVVSAEFILTGTLQQKLDFRTHSLSAPTSNLPTAGGRGRGRKKT